MAQSLYHFEIFRDGQLIEEVQRDATGPIKIGSHARVDLNLDDEAVSRVHALLEMSEEGAPTLIDLGSGRGTFVNGQRINKHVLHNGDVIRVGNTEIRFRLYEPRADGAAPGAPPIDAVPSMVTYSRRYLARPAKTDGTVEMAVLWRDNVLMDELYNPAEDITIGPGAETTVRLDDTLVKQDHLLVAAGEGKPVLRILDSMQGELFIGAQRHTIQEAIAQGVVKKNGGAWEVPFTLDVRSRLDFGKVSIFLHRSIELPPIATKRFDISAYTILLIAFLISFVLQFGLLFLGYLMPPDYSMNASEGFSADSRFVQLLLAEDVEEPEDTIPEWLQDDEDDEADNEGAIVAGEAGRAGDEREEDRNMKGTIGSTEGSGDPELARGAAREEALQTGALAALNSYAGGSPFGQGAGSYTDVVAIGGADGVAIGASYGTGGLGSYGGGLSTGSAVGGGGGFGIGPMAVRGRSTGTGTGAKHATLSDRGERKVAVKPGVAAIEGQLDREIIRRVVREHRREISACYQQQLQKDADLKGQITVSFVIDMSGKVAGSKVSKTTMNNKAVEDCVALRVQRWRFPQPKGGGIVRVNYPFTFVSE